MGDRARRFRSWERSRRQHRPGGPTDGPSPHPSRPFASVRLWPTHVDPLSEAGQPTTEGPFGSRVKRAIRPPASG